MSLGRTLRFSNLSGICAASGCDGASGANDAATNSVRSFMGGSDRAFSDGAVSGRTAGEGTVRRERLAKVTSGLPLASEGAPEVLLANRHFANRSTANRPIANRSIANRPAAQSLRPQIHDVHVHAQSRVVCEVPAHMVGILIDHHVIGVPQPTIAVLDVVWGNAEVEATKPKATGSATSEMVPVLRAEGGRKVAVLPRVIEVEVRIVSAGVVPDPPIVVGVDVRGRRVPGFVDVAVAACRPMIAGARGRRAVGRDMSAAYRMTVVLCPGRHGQ